jgi:DNA-binding beta-propeller fold protein YncE
MSKGIGYGVWGIGFIFFISLALVFASPANNKIQEAAYILMLEADTAKAEQLLRSTLASPNILMREKLNAHFYLAKIAEAKYDTLNAAKHYAFLKNNSQNVSLVYMAAEKEKLLGNAEKKIKIAQGKFSSEQKEESSAAYSGSDCAKEGELLAHHIVVYNCPNKNSLHLVSKKNGAEMGSVPYTDVPAKVFLIFDGFFLYCKNFLYFHKLNFENLKTYAWRIPALEVQDIEDMGDKIYVLDINGNISLLNKNSGQSLISAVKSDAEAFFNPGVGLIGTYQKNGGISVFDTLLNKLWDYQIDGMIDTAIVKSDSVIFYLQNGNSETLYTRHYQKFAVPAGISSDSLLAFESGNALAWYNIAKRENSDSAWKRAVIYGARKPEISQLIFDKYAEKTNAKWVKYLPVSSKMLYPQMFSDANWLFVYDFGSQSILKFSLETGNSGGEISLPKDREYTVRFNEPPWLILSSGDWLLPFSLKEQKNIPLEITGMPFSFLRSRDSIYVGLLNGFVLKYFMPNMRLEWSDKVSSAPVLLSRGENGIYSLSQGKISLLSSKQAGHKVGQELGGVAYFKYKDGMFAVASEDGEIQVFSESEGFKQLGAFSVRTPIVSLELLENNRKTYALAGGVNQTLSLYEIPSGTHVWTFNSKGSAYMQPVLHGSRIWIDQDGSVAAIDANSGKVAKSYSIFGSGASISIHGSTLYCATPEKLLYAFPL